MRQDSESAECGAAQVYRTPWQKNGLRYNGPMWRATMRINFLRVGMIAALILVPLVGTAQQVGRDKARSYFKKREPASEPAAPSYSTSSGAPPRVLMLHAGTYLSSEVWRWKIDQKQENVGKNTFGVTYRMGEWTNSMDFNLRIDFNEYSVEDVKPLKMSLLPLLIFPDAASQFPLYFGLGGGLGVFFKQNEGSSNLSFDYQLIAGVRLMNLFGGNGVFLETGLKNHLHLLSQGQFNGVFLALGGIFSF